MLAEKPEETILINLLIEKVKTSKAEEQRGSMPQTLLSLKPSKPLKKLDYTNESCDFESFMVNYIQINKSYANQLNELVLSMFIRNLKQRFSDVENFSIISSKVGSNYIKTEQPSNFSYKPMNRQQVVMTILLISSQIRDIYSDQLLYIYSIKPVLNMKLDFEKSCREHKNSKEDYIIKFFNRMTADSLLEVLSTLYNSYLVTVNLLKEIDAKFEEYNKIYSAYLKVSLL